MSDAGGGSRHGLPSETLQEPEVRHISRGMFQVTEAGRSTLAYAVDADDGTWVFLNGRVYVLERDHPASPGERAGSRSQTDELGLAAPMPATVVIVNVTPGQTVSRGDVMIVLEAMKMELQIAAPHDGHVRAVFCRRGDLVQPGRPLVELE